MSTMRAVLVQDDAERSLIWGETQMPEPGPGQIRFRALATAVNRADLLQRRGLYPVPPGASTIMGLEASGIVDKVGEGVEDWKPGDEVCALLEGGGYAEYVVIDASMALPAPPGVNIIDAAAVPEVFYTAYLNLYMEGALKEGQTAFIHAAASGVGTAALQLCRAFGNPVFASASESKLDACKEHGATWTIDRRNDNFKEIVLRETNKRGVDVIFDMVGGGVLRDNIDIAAIDGRIVLIGLLGGARDEIALNKILMKRIRLIGSTLRSRSREDKIAITREIREKVWPKFATGELKPVIDRRHRIEDVVEAHAALENNVTIGKVLMQIADR